MSSDYYSSLLVTVLLFGVVFLFFYSVYALYKRKKIERFSHLAFPKEYKAILRNIPLYQKLNAQEREQISHSIMLFINMKEMIGVSLKLTDEIKVIVAFHACLLLLHSKVSQCYENLSTVVIYPNTVIDKRVNNIEGIATKGPFLLEGQSSSDTVVLSWSDASKDAYHLYRDNVIIHEFAHELDFLDGSADGTPPLPNSKYHEWAKVLSHDFNRLQEVTLKERDWGKYKLLGSYAATNEAEFFAVVSERYFEKPEALKKHFPALYQELEDFYNIYKSIIIEKNTTKE